MPATYLLTCVPKPGKILKLSRQIKKSSVGHVTGLDRRHVVRQREAYRPTGDVGGFG